MLKWLDFPWTAAVAILAVIATAAHLAGGATIDGPLVHATWGHLVRDLALTLIAGAAYEAPMRRVWPALVIAGLVLPWIAVLATGAAGYYGVSGLSHALLAAALTFELRRRRNVWLGCLCFAGAAKIGYELATGAPAFPMDLGPGVHQATVAHAVGAALGAYIACFHLRYSGRIANAKATQPAPTIAISRPL
jgi:hypothetical protein